MNACTCGLIISLHRGFLGGTVLLWLYMMISALFLCMKNLFSIMLLPLVQCIIRATDNSSVCKQEGGKKWRAKHIMVETTSGRI